MAELQAGDPAWIGPFRLRERLGDGGGDGAGSLGPLYLGQSPLDHLVTIRTLHPDLAADKALRARLTRDVAAAREVAGSHVAPLVGADLSEPVPWFAWEWVPGESLADAVAQRGPLPWPAFEALATQLAEGIWSLHEAGVVHGDLTPGSVFLARDGAVVTGFGVCAAVAALRAAASALPGDVLEFLSPEQAAGGEATAASDMFSLGAVLAYALRGTGPYPVRERAGKGHAVDYDIPDLRGVPDFVRSLIERCLWADPARRAPSEGFAALIATTIRAVPARRIAAWTNPWAAVTPRAAAPSAAAAPTAVPPPSGSASPGQASSRTWSPRRRLAALIVSLVALTAVIGIIGVTAASHSGPRPPAPGATLVNFFSYQTGDCLIGDFAMYSSKPWPEFMWQVPCTDSHTYEVVYANFAYWPNNESYPGAQAVEDAGGAECDRRFTRYDGVHRENSLFTYTDVIPYTKDSWADGSRQVVCVAFESTGDHPDGVATRGSIKGSRR